MTNFMHRRSPVLANFTVHRNRAVSPSKTSLALFNRELSLTDVRTSFIRAVKFLLKNILTKSHIYIYPPLSLCHRNKPIYCRMIFPLDDGEEEEEEKFYSTRQFYYRYVISIYFRPWHVFWSIQGGQHHVAAAYSALIAATHVRTRFKDALKAV